MIGQGPYGTTVACVLITRLRAKSELRRRPDLDGCAFAIVHRLRAGIPVVDRSPQAGEVLPGMSLQQAMSICPGIVMLEADEPYYRSAFDGLLDSLGHVSDMVEAGGLGEAYVRLDGLERLYGGESGAASALLDAASDYLNPRVGVAYAKFPAYAAARTAEPMSVVRAPDDSSTFLAPMSIDILPVSVEMKSALYRFGLRLLGDVASTGRRAMFDRFGREGLFAWELSTGVDRRPFVPRRVEESIVEYTTLPFATTSMEMVRVGLDMLLRRAFSRAALRNRSVGAVTLMSSASDGEPWKLHVRFRTPAERWERAAELMRERIETEPPSHPIDDLSLTLSDLGGETGIQAGLIRDARESGREALVGVDRRLSSRFGGGRALHRAVEVAPWHPAPEMRSLLVPIDPLASDSVRALHMPAPAEVRETGIEGEHRPESLLRDGNWRPIQRIDERWKFDLWWLQRPMTRSYYRVESADGSLLTLFRDEVTDRWYTQTA